MQNCGDCDEGSILQRQQNRDREDLKGVAPLGREEVRFGRQELMAVTITDEQSNQRADKARPAPDDPDGIREGLDALIVSASLVDLGSDDRLVPESLGHPTIVSWPRKSPPDWWPRMKGPRPEPRVSRSIGPQSGL